MKFESFKKIPRFSRKIIITEKIDGTNGQIYIHETGVYTIPDSNCLYRFETILTDTCLDLYVGSRSRWIVPESDNFGFATWVKENAKELIKLGPGRHYGEWWGKGIQRGYGLSDKRFSLFNVERWNNKNAPACCNVVPVLYEGNFNTTEIESVLNELKECGSVAAPGYMNPEGIIIYHTASNYLFKKTLKNDEKGKPEYETSSS
jgi:hypothetical protein